MAREYFVHWRKKIIPYLDVPKRLDELSRNSVLSESVVMASCPADILHDGHIQYLEASAKVGDILVVVCNGSSFLKRKKGYEAFPAIERATMLAVLPWVDIVTIYDSDVQDVSECIRWIKPNFFTNGGDRANDMTAPVQEILATDDVGCERVYGVGGSHKINSSSNIAKLIMKQRPISEIHEMADKIAHSMECDRHDFDVIMTHGSGV